MRSKKWQRVWICRENLCINWRFRCGTRGDDLTGQTGYYAGLAAEDCVARYYSDRGLRLRARRWRGKGGEIDLIFEGPEGLVFVEVKKSRNFEAAIQRFTARQMTRICNAASEFIAHEPGQLDTPMRFDLALVDSYGRTEVVENILH